MAFIACMSATVALIAWADGHHRVIGILGIVLVLSAIASVFGGMAARSADEVSDRQPVIRLFRISTMTFASVIGLMAGAVFLLPMETETRMLVNGFALIYASGIAARHSERPLHTFVKLGLSLLPILVAAGLSGNLRLLLGALILLPLTVSFAIVTLTAFAALNQRLEEAADAAREAQQLREAALHDPLTGFTNRAGLEVAGTTLIEGLGEDRALAFVWMDLHRFRETNDRLGHDIGDRMLKEIAARIGQVTPAASIKARFAADEFVVLAEVASRAEADALTARLSLELSRPVRVAGHRIESGAAIGVAIYREDAQDLPGLQEKADLALYHAQIGGRHRVCFYDRGMTRETVKRKDIEADLRTAIQRDELAVFFQPIVDLKDGRIRAFEALVRWFHPTRGEVPPSEFIPVAEETGMIITLGNWIAGRAAKACAAWPEHVALALNLSARQIRAPGAALGIMQALREAKLDPRRLQIEVTENLLCEEGGYASLFFEELSAEGVRFVLDDFGTGQSSLHFIGKYPFGAIKVDERLISGSMAGRSSDAIIRAVAEMGTSLEMDVVAEGLETVEQVKAVRRAGCTLGQGFYYSRPVPDFMAANLLAEETSVVRIDRAAG